MDDLTLRYFEAEMRYLREAGKRIYPGTSGPGGNAQSR